MSKKVLVVDDSDTDAHKVTTMLEAEGFSVVRAEDGDKGIEMAASEKPDVVIMDVVMPGLNGFQATRAITNNEETAHIPVIVLTSKKQRTDAMWAGKQGAKAFLNKPVDKEELMSTLNGLI